MSFLTELINRVDSADLREEFQERVDLVAHKIMYMDRVPVVCLNTHNEVQVTLADSIFAAGGQLETDVLSAVYLIYYEEGKALVDLMREVPALLDQDWNAVKNGRVILVDENMLVIDDVENQIIRVENLAEMLHPGSFIYGFEGETWLRNNL